MPDAEVARIVALFEAAGCTAKVSSIHVNGWFGRYDKLTMTRIFLAEALGIELDADPHRFVFVGDSPNDQPMFAFFPASVGVANLRRFLPTLTGPPRWLTTAEGGHGFAELADSCSARRAERRECRALAREGARQQLVGAQSGRVVEHGAHDHELVAPTWAAKAESRSRRAAGSPTNSRARLARRKATSPPVSRDGPEPPPD